MSNTDYRTLIDRGRKAGLRTSELYRAIASHRPEGTNAVGQADSNGFVFCYDQNGHPTYRPLVGSERA
jgi:hypothetical protein